jgi:Phosphotransferase enzyme family
MENDRGVAVWSSARWRVRAVAWLDAQLAAAGIERTGDVEQPHLRPWSTVLRAPTTAGPVWMKAVGPSGAFEAGLAELLARTVPDHVLAPIAADPARGWLVLPDGGPPLGERTEGAEMIEGLVAALVQYGRLQRELEPRVGDLLALGIADMRPEAMPERFAEALGVVAEIGERMGRPDDVAVARRVARLEREVASWCERLAASPVPPSLDHNDLHPWNILGDGSADVRYYDWGDAVVAHPFAAMLVPLGFVQRGLGTGLDDPGFVRARDAYLGDFADLAPHDELVETLALACRVAKIARVLTWDRAVRSAWEQGETVDDYWTVAPVQTLASLLDESYLGGG